ncbi:MAG: hypothetical protein LBK82_04025 [Planctomycetaceae bacterium]|nr:hypothetical protein [Planctomycetaceae bacterium]
MIPKRKAIQIAAVNLIHSRLTPTQPFSERLPTLWSPTLWSSTFNLHNRKIKYFGLRFWVNLYILLTCAS